MQIICICFLFLSLDAYCLQIWSAKIVIIFLHTYLKTIYILIVIVIFSRAAHIMRGVGQRCSFNLHNATAAASASSSAASTTSTGSGSPPSSVHMCQIDSGYTTPSNLTHASVTTQETSAPSSSTSSASSTPTQGATPSASPNTIGSINLLMSMPGSGSAHTQQQPNKSELMSGPGGPRTGPGGPPPPPMGQNYQTMPRNYMGQSQVAVMTAGGTLQKVKRIYLWKKN